MSYGESVERAYWWTEVLDAYCRILILARQLGPIQYLSTQHTQELIDLRKQSGDSPIQALSRRTLKATSAAMLRSDTHGPAGRRRATRAHSKNQAEQVTEL